MKAAVLTVIKQPFVIEDLDFLEPATGRVLIRTGASPFCSSDIMNWDGTLSKIPPTILGHASMGEVLEIGPGVEHIRVGDRVIVPGTSECGICFYCSIGRPDQCSETFDRGGIWPHVANRKNGQPVSAAGNVGGYAEVMNVTAAQVFPVETDLPDEWLSLLGCGITTGVGAVMNIAKVEAGTTVAIFGLGHIGQWMVQAARIVGARQIIAVDPEPARREQAGRFGATHLIDPSQQDPVEVTRSLTGGRGADATLDAARQAAVMPVALAATRRAGTLVLTSVEAETAAITVSQVGMVASSKAVLGCQNGNVRMRRDLPRFIGMIEDGLLDPAPIVTRRYPLDQIDAALRASAERRDLSGVIVPALSSA